jgi:quercetin dioxygenase-like cupin family protein
VRVSLVGFEPGSRTHWHRHGGGQVLHVVVGAGLTQVEGGPVDEIREGDIVTVGPGEKHWHGAGAEGPMRHLAVTIGEVEWLEHPPTR